MGGADVVLGVQWLQSLGTIAFNFQELFIRFYTEGKEVELRCIAGKPGKIISSNGMKKLLKKEQRGVIAQLCSLDISTLESSISPDLQKVLDNHSKVWSDLFVLHLGFVPGIYPLLLTFLAPFQIGRASCRERV